MFRSAKKISIIIPVFNEHQSIKPLISRLELTLKHHIFEIIFIDDHSTDETLDYLKKIKKPYISILLKKGKQGKAYSILEGIKAAKGDYIAVIDGDLQYPPEAIPDMLEKLSKADIVVANRKVYQESKKRAFTSYIFRQFIGKFLFGLDVDIQSGLKVFRRTILKAVEFNPSSGWAFDLEFLYRAQQAGYKIEGYDITFARRKFGKTKISLFRSSFEIVSDALKLRITPMHPYVFYGAHGQVRGSGVRYKKNKYITHSQLPPRNSALNTFSGMQKIVFFLFILVVSIGLILNTLFTLQFIIAILSIVYFLDVLFNVFIIIKSLNNEKELSFSNKQLSKIDEKSLPIYSVLCPLFRESQIVPQFLEALEAIEWPKQKLEVLLLLEEDDIDTISEIRHMILPSYVKTIIVPNSEPKTKPKACNYGLTFATGEYVVIYDAEDKPDPLQLKKAYLGFQKLGKKVKCLQAKLNYYNPRQNLLTRLFTAEYSLWFDVTLVGLQTLNTAIPLGGTSNHFRTADLKVLQGWDPFNVTEDADLGIRIFKNGFQTAIIDSTTYEEANSRMNNWVKQRSRWLKGYMQTYLVHNRNFREFFSQSKLHALLFQINVGWKISFALINPILWITTISYFALRPIVGPYIESVYPTPIFYMAALSLVAGNFLFLYLYMIGCAKRQQWYLIKYAFFIPVYWVLWSIAGIVAFYQLLFKPHYWSKTTHGFHLPPTHEPTAEPKVIPIPAYAPVQFSITDDAARLLRPGIPTPLDIQSAVIEKMSETVETPKSPIKHLNQKQSTFTSKLHLQGFLFALLSMILLYFGTTSAHLHTSIFGSGCAYISFVLLFVYLLVAPFQITGELKNNTNLTHYISLFAFAFASLHTFTYIHNNSLSQSYTIYFYIIETMSLALIGYILSDKLKFSFVRASHPVLQLKGNKQGKQKTGLNILIFNWRDTKHIWAGGAEVYIQELSKRWVNEGNAVTIFCSNDRHHSSNQTIDGVYIMRRGGTYTVYFWALIYYLLTLRKQCDVIIDCENGIPFFTPLYTRKSVFLLIFHVHQEVIREHLKFPLSQLARLLEARVMPFLYRDHSLITISESSKTEIEKLGFHETKQPIEIIYSGVKTEGLSIVPKTSYPSFIYLGRLKPYKNIDVAIKSFANILQDYPSAHLTIAGEGESLEKLLELVQKLGITQNVHFTGRVTEKDKIKLLGESWVSLQPSQIEGWGITVIESNACGTPVIASDVNGLKDSVINSKTGLLVKVRNVNHMTVAMKAILENEQYRKYLSREAYQWSHNFDWNSSSQKFLHIIQKAVAGDEIIQLFPQPVAEII